MNQAAGRIAAPAWSAFPKAARRTSRTRIEVGNDHFDPLDSAQEVKDRDVADAEDNGFVPAAPSVVAIQNTRTIQIAGGSMPATIQHHSGNVYQVVISGILSKIDLERIQSIAAQEIERHGTVKLLFILAQFEGWKRNDDWNDMQFYATHGRKIDQIVLVGEERWRDQALMFAGAGLRKAPVQYFLPADADRARACLLQ